jgi:hypothetical protein
MVNEVVGKSAYRYRNHEAPFARRQKNCQLRRTTAHAKRFLTSTFLFLIIRITA